jgi:DNA-binding response OmpR family regulator
VGRASEEPTVNSIPEAKPTRILLVSPEVNFHRTLKRILGRCGYQIDVVDTGEEAMERIQTTEFDAVVSQVHLPGAVCGLTLLGQLRAQGIGVPVVILTEKETERLRRALESTTGATCLSKDTDLDCLKSTLAACLSPSTPSPTSQLRR